MNEINEYYNTDCINGAKEHLQDKSIDLIITDPPYGIDGDKLHKHYNRNEKNVLDGYIEIPKNEYKEFSNSWIQQANRVLKDDGSMYIISGWSNLTDILIALEKNEFKIINHIIWKYNFGVYTKKKYVSSHYHILYCKKNNNKNVKFNTNCRFGSDEKNEFGGSVVYADMEDVWYINREFKPGEIKNKNQLPTELLKKMILYSSDEDDLICDFFLGSFSTAKIAKSLNRNSIGFELNEISFNYQIDEINKIERGNISKNLKKIEKSIYFNQGKSWSQEERDDLISKYQHMKEDGYTDKKSFEILSKEFGRGKFSILNIIKRN